MGSKRDIFDSHTFSSSGDKVYDVSDYEAVFYTAVLDTGSATVHPYRAVSSSGTYVAFGSAKTITTTPDGEIVDTRGVNSLKFTSAGVSGEVMTLEVCGWSG